MRIYKIGNMNIFLVAMIMTAVLLCWSSKAQAAQTVDGFVEKYNKILITNHGFSECVALANAYNDEVVVCPFITANVASDWYNYYPNDPNEPIYYTRLDASQQPQKGDLAVWSTYPGNGGQSHIALVVDPLSGNNISCFTQNPLPAHDEIITRTGLLGYLRPKIFINTNDAQLNVKVNGSTVAFDQPPVIINNRTLVPLRAIFEAMGAQVNWNDATKTVTATKGDTIITAVIGSTQAIVNGVRKILDVPAQIFNSRTLVPVRFISESLGAKVDWDEASQTVIITDGQMPVERDALEGFESAYNAKMQEYRNSSKYYDILFGYKNKHLSYAKYDIDKDTIPELIVKTGTGEADTADYVYTYKNGKLISTGSLGAAHQGLFALSDQNGMLALSGYMGHEIVRKITLNNDTINSSIVFEKDIGDEGYDEFPNEIEMTTVFD